MPVLLRGTQAEVGITGLFRIRLSSWPVFHSKSGPLCHPAHRGVMLSQQDILPPQHHPHPASTRHPFIPRKGTKLICFYRLRFQSDLWSWWVDDNKSYLSIAAGNFGQLWVKLPFPNKDRLHSVWWLFKIASAFLTFGFYVQKLLEQTSRIT